MKEIGRKTANIKIIKWLNHFQAMSVIWWSLLVTVLPLIFSLFGVPIVIRVGLLFILVNSAISYHVGKLINSLKLKWWWLFLLPILFCLIVLIKFAKYNFIFGVIYLIFEVFGLMDKKIYN